MKHECNHDSLLNVMSEDIRETRAAVNALSETVLTRLPVVELKCETTSKNISKKTSMVTSSIVTLLIGVVITVLNVAISATPK